MPAWIALRSCTIASIDNVWTAPGKRSRPRVTLFVAAEIERALVSVVRADPAIEIVEHALVLDLLPAEVGPAEPAAVAGVTLHVLGEGTRGGVGAVHARAVILATGGIGQIYAVTTNPRVATADGWALAHQAGAQLRDIEFLQFHPTALKLPGVNPAPLISEAVRGAGLGCAA